MTRDSTTTLPPAPAPAPAPATRTRPRAGGAPFLVLAGAFVLAAIAVCVLVPGWLPVGDPATIRPSATLQGPTGQHLLGTDQFGRDVLSRVVHGARSAVAGPLLIAASTLLLATGLALVAGYRGGWVDAVIGRLADVLYAMPPLIVAIVLVGVFGGSYWLGVVVLIVLTLPQNFRLIRAAVLERRSLPYVQAAQTLGIRPSRIMLWHLLPNVMPVVAVCFFLRFTYGLVDLSALSFLGLGVPPGSPDWGRMLAENRTLLAINPWAAVVPGAALVLTAVSANFVGDWLYERSERRGGNR